MASQQVVAFLVLTALQLLVIRVSQVLLPGLYFTTSSLFDRRKDVAGRAVLFRLAIPLTTGVLAYYLVDEHAGRVAAMAGATAWFLVIWPVIWSPALAGQPPTWPFLLVLMAFWAAFTVLAPAGTAAVDLVNDVLDRRAPEWQAQTVWAGLALVIAAVVQYLNRFAAKRLSFADDPVDAWPEDEELPDHELERVGRHRLWRRPERSWNGRSWRWLWVGAIPAVFALARLRRRR